LRRCGIRRIFNEVNNQENNNKMDNKIKIQMTNKDEALLFLVKQITERKSFVNYVNKSGGKDTMTELIVQDKKEEIEALLNIMDLILEA
jgi:hypothetical protein